ncbi:MAG: hypothetical protein AAGD10_05815 [Myxococcota bacterium]
MEGSPEDLKKTTCRGLTGVLKRSPVAEAVDPKSFFMMLNSNFAVLAREEGIDLGPIFEALKANAPEEQLAGLFLQFERKGEELGIQMILPPSVAALEADQRANLLEEAQRHAAPVSAPTETVDAPADGAQEADGLSDEQRKLVTLLVRAFREAPGSHRIPAGQLNYFVGANLAKMMEHDGQSLKLDVLIDALRQAEVTDPDLYVGYVFAREKLQGLGIEVAEPTLEVDPEVKEGLVETAKEALRAEPRGPSISAREASSAAKAKAGSTARTPSGPAEGDRRSLEELGLGRKDQNPARRRAIRMGVMLGVAVLSAGLGFLFRPTRPLSAASYAATVPLVEAALVDGAFQGVLDDTAWSRLDETTKRSRFDAFAEILSQEGRVVGAQIRDRSGRLLIAASGAKLRASPQLFKY